MKLSTLALSAAVLGASLAPALADTPNLNSQLVPAAQAQAAGTVVEGRQAAPIAATAPLTSAERYVIDRTDGSQDH